LKRKSRRQGNKGIPDSLERKRKEEKAEEEKRKALAAKAAEKKDSVNTPSRKPQTNNHIKPDIVMADEGPFKEGNCGVIINCNVHPGARKASAGLHGSIVKIKLHAPPSTQGQTES
jgi:hypothetical protein